MPEDTTFIDQVTGARVNLWPLSLRINIGPIEEVLAAPCHAHRQLLSEIQHPQPPWAEPVYDDEGFLVYWISIYRSAGGEEWGTEATITQSVGYGAITAKLSGGADLVTAVPRAVGSALDLQWWDLALPLRWRTICDSHHLRLCKATEGPLGSLTGLEGPARLLDVHDLCVVKPPAGPISYAALSYVWGKATVLKSLTSNIRHLQKKNALSEHSHFGVQLPKTIRHAMLVARLLGLRYLWVDSICIVQDSDEERQGEIQRMWAIYANASVTIFAKDGTSADAGLQGIKGTSDPRQIPGDQTVNQLAAGLSLVRASPGLIEGLDPPVHLKSCVWNTRAWTYQESVFSRRRLVFFNGLISWQCAHAHWSELETVSPSLTGQLVPREDSRDKVLLPVSKTERAATPNFLLFMDIVEDFNSKKLSYPEDAHDAFTGVLSSLAMSFPGGFISALPTLIFSEALIWTPRHGLDPTARRTAASSPTTTASRKSKLPSWSWIGWEGTIWWAYVFRSVDFLRVNSAPGFTMTPTVQWRSHTRPDGPGTPIPDIRSKYKHLQNSTTPTLPSQWERHQKDNDIYYTPPDTQTLPDTDYQYPIPSASEIDPNNTVELTPYISTRTRRAFLHNGKNNPIKHDFDINITDRNGTLVGFLTPNEGKADTIVDMDLELVEIAFGEWPVTSKKHYEEVVDEIAFSGSVGTYEFYWVMWISWEGGIAYRRGIGRVFKGAWEREVKGEIDLMLG